MNPALIPQGRPPGGRPARRFWILACLIYATLIYSTAIHYAFGPEKTINLTFYTWPQENNPVLQEHFPDKGRWHDLDLQDVDSRFVPVDFWKLTTVWGDAGYYLLQAEGRDPSIAPFKYRVLPPALVGVIHTLTGAPASIIFAVLNCLLTLCTAVLFTHYLLSDFGFSELTALLGGVLFVTMAANTQTIPLPMLEPASFLFCVLIFIALHRHDYRLFIIAASLGVATKEILVTTCLLWLINSLAIKDRSIRGWMTAVVPAVVPVIVFMAIRAALGGGLAEVNYGYDLFSGEIPLQYAGRLLKAWSAADVVLRVFLAFSFIWAGLLNSARNPFLRRNIFLIPVIIVATVILSSRIVRIVGIVFPIVIPLFLLFLEHPARRPTNARVAPAGHPGTA